MPELFANKWEASIEMVSMFTQSYRIGCVISYNFLILTQGQRQCLDPSLDLELALSLWNNLSVMRLILPYWNVQHSPLLDCTAVTTPKMLE